MLLRLFDKVQARRGPPPRGGPGSRLPLSPAFTFLIAVIVLAVFLPVFIAGAQSSFDKLSRTNGDSDFPVVLREQ